MEKKKSQQTRRNFLGNAIAVSAIGALGVQGIVSACGRTKITIPVPPDSAPDGPVLTAGLIGCGGRGTGAAVNFLDAGPNLKITALGDLFEDRLNSARSKLLKNKQNEIADDHCFLGFDAYEKVIDSGVDVIIMATPPHFRPMQFEAAIKAGKHVFMEKPVAVDPEGARSIMATGKKAEGMGLSVAAGTQRRHQRDYQKTYEQVINGGIGDIVSATCYWNGGKLWHKNHQEGWSDMEWMVRNWVNWIWLSGDHIVEQHVHNLDVINWFKGKLHPIKAVGFGSRQRRITGDQFDNFSVDFIYDDEMHMHSMCRQINDCTNSVSEYIRGTNGYTNCKNATFNVDGTPSWGYDYGLNPEGEPLTNTEISPYVQEHIDLVTAIRTNQPINDAENVANSTMTAIMGRISAYTGKAVTWEEVMNSDLRLGPKEYILGPMDMTANIPVPGSAPKES